MKNLQQESILRTPTFLTRKVVVLNYQVNTQDDLDLVKKGLDVIQEYLGIGYQPNPSASLALQSVGRAS